MPKKMHKRKAGARQKRAVKPYQLDVHIDEGYNPSGPLLRERGSDVTVAHVFAGCGKPAFQFAVTLAQAFNENAGTTKNGYDVRWIAAINQALSDRDTKIRIKDISDDFWAEHIGPMIDEIEECGCAI